MKGAKKMRKISILVLAIIVVAGGFERTAAQSNSENPHLWKPKVKSVAVFKNGLGFFTRQGDVSLSDGWCVTKQIPPAVFGALAIYSGNKNHLVDIVGSGPGEIIEFDGQDAPNDIDHKRNRLETIKDLKVQLTYEYKGKSRTAAGKLISIGPEFVVLEAENNSYAVPVEEITKTQVLDLPVRIHVNSDSGKPPEKTDLHMAYLRKGITWIPEYTLQILDDNTAELTLRGTVINEAEDLIHCDINFVVGVPHFVHTDYLAPIAIGQVIRTIGAATAPPQIRNQIMNRAAIAYNTMGAGQFSPGNEVVDSKISGKGGDVYGKLGNLPKMETVAGNDYTVYSKKDMTIRRGEKAIVTLFVKKIRYSHIYRWSPPEKMEHFLVLANDTDTPWTTGPYLAVSNQRPLSEDLLRYTPKGGKCEIPVTESINIAHDKSEEEIERETNAHQINRSYYLDLVFVEGKLKLRNFENKNVDIIIKTQIPGKPASASDSGILKSDSTKLKLTERRGTIHWNLKLKKGETKILTYKYDRYVRSG